MKVSPICCQQLELGVQFQFEVFETDFHWPASVHLEPEDAASRDFWVVDIDARNAVNSGAHFAADGDNLVSVPVVRFDTGIAGFVPKQRAAVFLVEFAPPASAGVGLQAFHFVLAEWFAVKLYTAVFFVRREFDFDNKAEIFEGSFALEEFVMLETGGCATHDFAVLNAPEGHVPLPVRKISTVEQRVSGNGDGWKRGLGRAAQIIK